jgi:hypothetical protein
MLTKQHPWDGLHERFEIKRINHQEAYSLDGACSNMAEEYFSCRRRAEIGIHHHIAGAYLLRYAQESSWRETIKPGQSLGLVSLKFTFVLSEERVPCGYPDKLLLSEQY